MTAWADEAARRQRALDVAIADAAAALEAGDERAVIIARAAVLGAAEAIDTWYRDGRPGDPS